MRKRTCATLACPTLVTPPAKRCKACAARVERVSREDQAAMRARLDASGAGQCKQYGMKRWRAARSMWLAQHPLCAHCRQPANEVHHLDPHGGDVQLFWRGVAEGRLQTLCGPCHRRESGRSVSYGRKTQSGQGGAEPELHPEARCGRCGFIALEREARTEGWLPITPTEWRCPDCLQRERRQQQAQWAKARARSAKD